MRIIRYRLDIEVYIISNGDSNIGTVGNLPIRLIPLKGFDSDNVIADDALEDIFDELIGGETDYILTSVWVNAFGIHLSFTHKRTGEEAEFEFFKPGVQHEEIEFNLEVDRGDGMIDRYHIDTTPEKVADSRSGEAYVEYLPRILEQHGSDKRIIDFKRNPHNEIDRWAIVTEECGNNT